MIEDTVEKFIKENKSSSFENLMNNLSQQSDDVKRLLLSNDIIKSKIFSLLKSKKYISNIKFNYIFSSISINEFFSTFSHDELSKELTNLIIGRMYDYLSNNKQEEFINTIVLYDDYFRDFCANIHTFYLSLREIKYEDFLLIIKTAEEKNIDLKSVVNLLFFKEEYQYDLLKEDLLISTKKFIVECLTKKVLNKVFEDDGLSLAIFPFIQTYRILDCKINRNILLKKEFFECIKMFSLVQLRTNINKLAPNNDVFILEKRTEEYEEALIKTFNYDQGMFDAYVNLLKDNIVDDDAYLMNVLENIDEYSDKVEYLKSMTNIKLSEIIVDRLFKDNYYNVICNIKELLRYNLSNGKKLISSEEESFYNDILNIDKMSPKDKIEFFYKYKDKEIISTFYDNIRKSKDSAYTGIKEKLLTLDYCKKFINERLSKKYKTIIYDLRDKEFYMLVRYMHSKIVDTTSHHRDCYMIISNNNTTTFGSEDYFLYGYLTFNNEDIVHMNDGDSFSNDFDNNKSFTASNSINKIMTIYELVSNKFHNEIQILNFKGETSDTYSTKMPDYIVIKDNTIDEVMDIVVKEANRLNIPIIIISDNTLENYNSFEKDNDDEYVLDYMSECSKVLTRI